VERTGHEPHQLFWQRYGPPFTTTLDGMQEPSRYTSAAIGMARWYFRLGGGILAFAGVAVWFYTGMQYLLPVVLMVAVGLSLFAFSFARRGDRVASAAREHLEVVDGD
jgi:Flp pilus assembly protein TadB